jgi:hypothetical protein
MLQEIDVHIQPGSVPLIIPCGIGDEDRGSRRIDVT